MLALPLLILQGHYSSPGELSSTTPFFAVETSLQFGLHSAPFLFNQPVTAIHWILQHKYSIHHSLQCHSVWYRCRMSCSCYLSPHAAQFAICCHMPCSLLFVATCHAVCSLLPHAMQFALCCYMPCSLLLVSACCAICYLLLHAMQLLFVATCRTVCYLLLFVPTCRTVCYLLPHAMQFAIYCRVPCSLLFVAACRAVC